VNADGSVGERVRVHIGQHSMRAQGCTSEVLFIIQGMIERRKRMCTDGWVL
jgi:hypothetical protein